MAVSARMACQFSKDGKYFAQITSEGKLKVWNTLSNTFEQEFTPDFHLTSPCTCLHFISSEAASKSGSPRKKKRKESLGESNTCVALGTSNGRLLLYSLVKGDLEYIVDSATSQSVNCLSSITNEFVYSGADTHVIVWNLSKRNVSSKWNAGNDKIYAILLTPLGDKLLTASKSIKLWDVKSKEVLKTFTGHSSPVTMLEYINPRSDAADAYVVSGSKGDRLLSCWNLNDSVDGKNAVASFLMEDIVNNLSIFVDHDGSSRMAATVRSGVVHIYHHTLNGKKSNKPIKPKTTIQIVSDSGTKDAVNPIYITAAAYRSAETLCICYGSAVVQTFEDITISSYKKVQCLLREDIHKKTVSKENQVTKVRTPVVGNDVHYLTTQTSSAPSKRKNDGQQEVPMEKRLENLMVNEEDSSSKVPKANNAAQLLIQGLHSKDKNILRTVLFKKDEQLIKNTIKRIPLSLITPLFEELTKLIQGKTLSRQVGLTWLKNLILIHSGLLLSNPDLSSFFGEALGSIEAGLALQSPRNKLMGRLELLIAQINHTPQQDSHDNEALLVFNDKASSDSENEGMEFEAHSSSENEWEEEDSEGGDNENEKVDESDYENDDGSDEPMSS
ncbi:WD repeat-containing protein 43 isoform X2 [Tribolium castaneum]|nr:PREDICTED: WD repeat-containing protein 43 isoform X2 [Tribolium castaneum]|eukprot:XP_015833864.1 PREDICTED: WD repeat-containing protein 43 isoform X2 [Tribolium castaneum]